MLRKGKELLQFIKTENKIPNQKVKDIQTQINQCVYEHNLGFLSPVSANTIYNEFVELGKELNEVEVTDKQKAHKNECLIQLRNNCRNLQHYAKQGLDANDIQTAEGIIKFRLYTYLKDKRDGLLSTQKIMEHLELNDDIYRNILTPLGLGNFEYKDLKNFTDISVELLAKLNERYNYEIQA